MKIERKKKHFKKLLLEISQTCIFKQPSKEKKGADWCKEKKGGKENNGKPTITMNFFNQKNKNEK